MYSACGLLTFLNTGPCACLQGLNRLFHLFLAAQAQRNRLTTQNIHKEARIPCASHSSLATTFSLPQSDYLVMYPERQSNRTGKDDYYRDHESHRQLPAQYAPAIGVAEWNPSYYYGTVEYGDESVSNFPPVGSNLQDDVPWMDTYNVNAVLEWSSWSPQWLEANLVAGTTQ